MSRLGHRALSALLREPRPALGAMARYLALRRATRRSVARDGLDVVLARLDRPRRRAHAAVTDLESAIVLGDALVTMARRARVMSHEADTCLMRALARYALLVEHGNDPALCIGIDPVRVHDVAAVEVGHAWVEIDGVPLLGERLPMLVRSFRHARGNDIDHPGEIPG